MYHYVKDPVSGQSRLVDIGDNEIQAVPVVQPVTITLGGSTKRFRCMVSGCGKAFKTEGVFSIHYNRNHLKTEDKQEWRQFMEKVDVSNAQ